MVLVIQLGPGVGQAQQLPAADLVVTKSVTPAAVAPGDYVVYSVTLQNTTAADVEVSSLVDTLPDDFEYIGLAWNSEWGEEPWDNVAPEIQWTGPITVPASDSLTLRYKIYIPESVPLSPDPHTNTATATVNSTEYSAEAVLVVGVGEASVEKTASPMQVYPGELVTYTVTFGNSGYTTLSLTTVSDVLPDGITFVEMTANSQVPDPPSGDTGTITWDGPFGIPSLDEFVVEYVVSTPETSDTLRLQNLVSGHLGDGTVVEDSVEIRVSSSQDTTVYMPLIFHRYAPPYFTATKTADPTQVLPDPPGGLITYEVVFTNIGTLAGELASISDVLPTGFTFVGMLPGSDISAPPSGTTGEVTWDGPFAIEGESSLRLVYQVRATTTVGPSYVNTATAIVSEGRPDQVSASASVAVQQPVLLFENWNSPSPHWEPFLNYPRRLRADQWYVAPNGGVNSTPGLKHACYIGFNDYWCDEEGAHDAIYMYRAPGSENWTDYRFEADVSLNTGSIIGFWFRGTYEQSELGGRDVGGYYLTLVPSSDRVKLMRLPDEGTWAYHFAAAIELITGEYDGLSKKTWYHVAIEVRGSNIKIFVRDTLVIDYNDAHYPTGTVGLKTYRVQDGAWDNIKVTSLP
jgi:uncharacterized repeat protein (TIGR01451 family)